MKQKSLRVDQNVLKTSNTLCKALFLFCIFTQLPTILNFFFTFVHVGNKILLLIKATFYI